MNMITFALGYVGVMAVMMVFAIWWLYFRGTPVEIHPIGKKTDDGTTYLPPVYYDTAIKDKTTKGETLRLSRLKEPIEEFAESRITFTLPFLGLVREKLVVWTENMKEFKPVDFSYLKSPERLGIIPKKHNSRQYYVNVKNNITMKRDKLKISPTAIMAGTFIMAMFIWLIMAKQLNSSFAETLAEGAKPLAEAAGNLRGSAEALGNLPPG